MNPSRRTACTAITSHVFLQCRAYPQLQIDSRPVPLKLKRGLALLVYLSELARPRSRRQVAETLWPDAQADIGRARLRRLCHEVNSAIGLDLLVGDADALWLGCTVDTDVAVARRHAQGVLASAAGTASPASLQCLVTGDSHQLLEGFDLDSDLFYAWLDMRRSELERLVLRALERLAESFCQRQQPGPAIAAAARLIALDPCADAGHAALLEARAMQGEAAAVEACYFECAEVLRGELGIRPTARIEAAYARARLRLERPSEIREPEPSRLQVRFAETGDGAVAYLELGQSDTTLLVNLGLWSHLEVAWDEPRIRAVLDRLSRHFRVVLKVPIPLKLSCRRSRRRRMLEPLRSNLAGSSLTRRLLFGSNRIPHLNPDASTPRAKGGKSAHGNRHTPGLVATNHG